MNKYYLILAVLAFVAICHAEDEHETKRSFLNFMHKYNKQYSGPEEINHRYENFKASIARAAEKNKNSKGAVFGITKFSDLSVEEFRNTMLMKNPIQVNTQPRDPSRVLPQRNVEVPATWDWRTKGAVTPVKDQGQCGSCWAFSVTENIESMWILAGKGTNKSVDLAPQQIVDCDDSDGGCDGGNPPTAYDYVIDAGGLESNSTYKYTAQDGNCRFNKKAVVAKISSWQWATELYSESAVVSSLVSWGPLSVCVDASNWQDYQKGVMTWSECALVPVLDHCVQLVGYDNSNPQKGYYFVRNSWNTDWGVDGYIYLQMGEDTCGITHEASCAIV